MTPYAPMCYSCVHYNDDDDDLTCGAFPDGIPEPILLSQFDHRYPYDGDDGVLFEQNPSLPEPALFSDDASAQG